MSDVLRFPHKKIRAEKIKQYMQQAGYKKAVCFSCGNAARELLRAGVPTIHIGEKGILTPKVWFKQAEIHDTFPECFDATSGHLPMELMLRIGRAYREYLGDLDECVYVPTGSGETLVCLKLAYPDTDFVAIYNIDEKTEYSEDAPLNGLVKELAFDIVFANEKVDNENPF